MSLHMQLNKQSFNKEKIFSTEEIEISRKIKETFASHKKIREAFNYIIEQIEKRLEKKKCCALSLKKTSERILKEFQLYTLEELIINILLVHWSFRGRSSFR